MGLSRWLPKNVSTYGGEIDWQFHLIYWITGIVFLLVAVTMVGFLIVYRDRKDGRRAVYSHGNNTLEVIWTVIPSIIFVLIALSSAGAWDRIKIHQPTPDITIQVVAKQFEWRFIYSPGPDGQYGRVEGKDWSKEAKDDIFDDNGFRAPVGKKVRLNLTSADVIHSFFVPQLRLKQDALPGRTIPSWFEATEAGDFEIACAELCGFGHTRMNGTPAKANRSIGGGLHLLSAADYQTWAIKKKLLAPPAAETAPPEPPPNETPSAAPSAPPAAPPATTPE